MDDILILASTFFAHNEKHAIQSTKFITKKRNHLSTAHFLKFNGTKIELASDSSFTLRHETHAGDIILVKDFEASTISSRGVVHTKLSPQEHYISQRARRAHLASICQSEASFNLSYAV